ncbi:YbbR-like domain-containing protein [Pseudalkalibacillus sp. SCS-8]|uniref:CdaR family protein n=1 Tax=Pseudalkalibacillus nanhaiensis TaxID=3115291 RepID=UPI0032DB6B6D
MDKLLRSPWFVKITAFLIALMMYTSVNITNQDAEQQDEGFRTDSGTYYKTVSLEAEYDDDKYVLMGKPDTVDVRIIGSQADITNMNLQRARNAYIDLSGKGPGQYEVPVRMDNVPRGVELKFEQETVTVTLHEKKTETFPVTVQLLDEESLPEGYVVGTPKVQQEEIEITGAKEIIDEIAYVRAFVNVGEAKKTFTREVKIQALNKSYDPIDIAIDPPTTEVTVPIENPSKKISLSLKERGSLPDGFELKEIKANTDEITIHAPKDILDRLNTVDIPVDLSNITEDEEIEIDVPLPDGAFYSTPDKVKVKIDVEQVEDSSGEPSSETATKPEEENESKEATSTKTFKDLPIAIRGLGENQQASFDSPVNGVMDVTIKGPKENVEDLSEEKVTAFIDAEGLSEGTHDVEINVDVPEAVTYERNITKATLTISEGTA